MAALPLKESGKIGGATVFDQALAILALEAGGTTRSADGSPLAAGGAVPGRRVVLRQPVPADRATTRLLGRSARTTSSPRTRTRRPTPCRPSSTSGRDSFTDDPFAFFRARRDAVHDGWGYTPGFGTDANSTALVIQAYAAAELAVPAGGLNALRALQPDVVLGAWAYTYVGDEPGDPDLGATIGAVPAILQVPLPIVPGAPDAGTGGLTAVRGPRAAASRPRPAAAGARAGGGAARCVACAAEAAGAPHAALVVDTGGQTHDVLRDARRADGERASG